MRRRSLLAAGLAALPMASLTRLDEALALTPETAGPVSHAKVTARLRAAWQAFDDGRLAEVVQGLPTLLATAHRTADQDADQPAVWVLVAGVYDLATEALHKIGAGPRSRLTADRAMTYAARSQDPIAMAAAARSLGVVLRHEDQQTLAQRVTMQAAARLEATGLTTTEQAAAYAQTLCTTGYNAALAGDRDGALEMMSQAHRAARHLPARRPTRLNTAHRFAITPAQVALYDVSVRWGLGDAGAALAAGTDLRPEQFPTPERRARLHIDMARAYAQRGWPEPAIGRLLDAYHQAPGEVRDRHSIRRVAIDLVHRSPRIPGARELAALL
ncbi:hypothetical protein [Actinomadura macra]|uniref:hypothetical protein n=1 Tax=Actinomadura macra TaxID=46164 RepID=UPI001FDF5074|nr:hypothetical protein [Actinomadura macra]